MRSRAIWQMVYDSEHHDPLYYHLRLAYDRYEMWLTYHFNGRAMIRFVLTMLLSPLFFLTPFVLVWLAAPYWAGFIAGMIRFEQQHERFDLIAITPRGTLGTYQTMASLHLRRTGTLQLLRDALQVISFMGVFLVLMSSAGLVIGFSSQVRGEDLQAIVQVFVLVILVFGSSYFDQMQAASLAVVLGMSVPTVTQSTFEARLVAPVAYLFIQIAIYGVALMLYSGVQWLLVWPGWAFFVGLSLAILWVLAVREWTIDALWRAFLSNLGEDS